MASRTPENESSIQSRLETVEARSASTLLKNVDASRPWASVAKVRVRYSSPGRAPVLSRKAISPKLRSPVSEARSRVS